MGNRLKHPAQGRTDLGMGTHGVKKFSPFIFLTAIKSINKSFHKSTSRSVYGRKGMVGVGFGFNEEKGGRPLDFWIIVVGDSFKNISRVCSDLIDSISNDLLKVLLYFRFLDLQQNSGNITPFFCEVSTQFTFSPKTTLRSQFRWLCDCDKHNLRKIPNLLNGGNSHSV